MQQTPYHPAWRQHTSIKKAFRLPQVTLISLVLTLLFQYLKGMNRLSFLSWLEYLCTFVFLVTNGLGLVLLIKGLSHYRRESKRAQQ